MSDANKNSLIEHAFSAKKLVNSERAYEVMDKYDLSGLVASIPHNIYYLSSHHGIMQWMGRHFSTFAFFPRNPDAEPALILHGTMLYHLDYRPTWIENIIPISGPKVDENGDVLRRTNGDIMAINKPGIWPAREGAEFKRGDIIQQQLFERFTGKTTPSSLQGLKNAIEAGGGATGRIGFDDPRVGHWLNDMGLPNMTSVDACNVFKEIRMVKTEAEISLLKIASRYNEIALDHAIGKIEPGQPLIDIEYNHARKWAELGGRAKWLIANINGVNSGTAEQGDFIKLDSVGVINGYHGDVGRTVVLGEPSDELAARIEANTKISQQIYQTIRPGMLYTDVCKQFSDMMRAEGFEIGLAGPHDVGLEHTDHPFETGHESTPANIPYSELRFHENSVFTLDMPHNELGWGTTHVEDMMVVKKNGCVPLSSGNTSLRIV